MGVHSLPGRPKPEPETGLRQNILGGVTRVSSTSTVAVAASISSSIHPIPLFPRIPQLLLSVHISYSQHQNASPERCWSSWYRCPHHGRWRPCRPDCLPCTSSRVRNVIGTSPAHFLCLASAHLSHRALHRAVHRVYPRLSMDRLSSYQTDPRRRRDLLLCGSVGG